MKKQFKQLKPKNKEMPEELRQEVFDSLQSLRLVVDILDLFVVKYSLSELELLLLINDQDKTSE